MARTRAMLSSTSDGSPPSKRAIRTNTSLPPSRSNRAPNAAYALSDGSLCHAHEGDASLSFEDRSLRDAPSSCSSDSARGGRSLAPAVRRLRAERRLKKRRWPQGRKCNPRGTSSRSAVTCFGLRAFGAHGLPAGRWSNAARAPRECRRRRRWSRRSRRREPGSRSSSRRSSSRWFSSAGTCLAKKSRPSSVRRSRTRWECGHHSDWNSAGNILAGLVEAVLVQVDPVDDDLVVLEVVGHLDRDVLADHEHPLVEVYAVLRRPRPGVCRRRSDRQPEPCGRIDLRVARERQRLPNATPAETATSAPRGPSYRSLTSRATPGSASRGRGYRSRERDESGGTMTTSVIRRLAASQPWSIRSATPSNPGCERCSAAVPACGTRSTAGGSALLCTRC